MKEKKNISSHRKMLKEHFSKLSYKELLRCLNTKPCNIEYVVVDRQTQEMANLVFSLNPIMIIHICVEFHTEHMRDVLYNDPELHKYLRCLRSDLRQDKDIKDIVSEIVKPIHAKRVELDIELKDYFNKLSYEEMLQRLKTNPSNIKYVSVDRQTQEMANMVFSLNPRTISHIYRKFHTEDMRDVLYNDHKLHKYLKHLRIDLRRGNVFGIVQ